MAYEEIQIVANIDEEQTQTVQEAIKTAPPKSSSRRKTLERTLTVESVAEVIYVSLHISKIKISYSYIKHELSIMM